MDIDSLTSDGNIRENVIHPVDDPCSDDINTLRPKIQSEQILLFVCNGTGPSFVPDSSRYHTCPCEQFSPSRYEQPASSTALKRRRGYKSDTTGNSSALYFLKY